ncbi:MAG: hypothetical protein WKF81_12015 [Thermomicrobiales bacterium]
MSDTPENQTVNGSPYRIRDTRGSELSEIWLVSAAVAILGIRGYLHLTGYPQVGGDTLHIAHMLWGGLGMVVAFGILMLFASDAWKPFAALVGGLGFGTFVDELGKFITKDNNYFFQPTIGLIYGILVGFYLLAQWTQRHRDPTSADRLFYATQGIQSLAIGKLDYDRQQFALGHLKASGIVSPLTEAMRTALEEAPLIDEDDAQSSRMLRWRKSWLRTYSRIVERHWFTPIVLGIFVLKVATILLSFVFGIVTDSLTLGNGLSFVEWGVVLSGIASGAVAVLGVWFLFRRERLRALHSFAASTLITVLFGQFFAFTTNQFAALGHLVEQLLVLGVLRFAISAEDREQRNPEDPETT